MKALIFMHRPPARALRRVFLAPFTGLFLIRGLFSLNKIHLENVVEVWPRNSDKFKFGAHFLRVNETGLGCRWMVFVEECTFYGSFLLLIDSFINHMLWIIVYRWWNHKCSIIFWKGKLFIYFLIQTLRKKHS